MKKIYVVLWKGVHDRWNANPDTCTSWKQAKALQKRDRASGFDTIVVPVQLNKVRISRGRP